MLGGGRSDPVAGVDRFFVFPSAEDHPVRWFELPVVMAVPFDIGRELRLPRFRFARSLIAWIGWECKKHPSTRIAPFTLGKAMSGEAPDR